MCELDPLVSCRLRSTPLYVPQANSTPTPVTLRPLLVLDAAEMPGLESHTRDFMLISTHSFNRSSLIDISIKERVMVGERVRVRHTFSMSQGTAKLSTPCGWSHSPPRAARTTTQLIR